MDEKPRQDPLALIVVGVALALVAAIGLYLVYSIRSQPEPATEPAQKAESFAQKVREGMRKMVAAFESKPEPPKPAAPAPRPQAQVQVAKPQPVQPQSQPQAQPSKAAAQPPPGKLEAGHTFRYTVRVEPEVWKNVTLTYRTVDEAGGLGVRTEFQHAGGNSAFNLGTFAANHPSHGNTRFPGFFMYASYLVHPLQPGQKVSFGWPWQGGGGKPGRIKRFEGQVMGWEEVELKAGKVRAFRIMGNLSYVEDGKVQARALETFWFAPAVAQIVKIEREGKVPDESSSRISAELAEYR
jgi:hypothetical protein